MFNRRRRVCDWFVEPSSRWHLSASPGLMAHGRAAARGHVAPAAQLRHHSRRVAARRVGTWPSSTPGRSPGSSITLNANAATACTPANARLVAIQAPVPVGRPRSSRARRVHLVSPGHPPEPSDRGAEKRDQCCGGAEPGDDGAHARSFRVGAAGFAWPGPGGRVAGPLTGSFAVDLVSSLRVRLATCGIRSLMAITRSTANLAV